MASLADAQAHSSVHFALPPSSLFKFPPLPLPETLVPPVSDFSLARPFNIHPATYNELLSINYPITIAAAYATTVFFLNKLNKRRGNRPWPISKTRPFFFFVIAHNVLLALYSGWTFVGMINAVKNVWPGLDSGNGAASVVDAFCKLSGPRGFSSAVSYSPGENQWKITNQTVKLLGFNPDPSDIGRLWNEGLAFYGWLFYLSKFYEVLDTLIILAKGKKSSLLQTYHHAGAMLGMWAGIRYMSPPIWMFVAFNSGIHTLMYTYYTITALNFRVPMAIKRTLTTLQIAQFVIGSSYALLHLFLAYDMPIQNPYLFTHNLSTALPSVTSSIASAATSAGVGSWLKKVALRAAGEEGLAENVRNQQGETFGIDAVKALESEKARQEIRYRWENTKVHCIDTSGQAFAICLNVLYLLPLTYLFVRFFIRSYIKRTSSSAKHPTQQRAIQRSSFDAMKGVEREVLRAVRGDRGSVTNSDDEYAVSVTPEIKEKIDDLKAALKRASGKVGDKANEATVDKRQSIPDFGAKAKELVGKAYEKAKAEPIYSGNESDEIKKEDASCDAENDSNGTKEQKKARNGNGGADEDSKAYEASVDDVTSEEQKKKAADAMKESKGGKVKGENGVKAEKDEQKKDPAAYEASLDEVTTKEQKKKAKNAMKS